MLVFWKEKLVFLAVPKTGTTAFEAALKDRADIAILNPPGLKHAPVYRYNRFLKPLFGKVGGGAIDTLAIIREPIDWLGSWYRYRSRPQISGSAESTESLSFDDFVQGYIEPDQPAFARVGSQARFVSDLSGRPAVTHLFRYDDQDQLVAFLENRLKTTLQLEPKNVSPKLNLALSPKIERRLRANCADDFSLWKSLG